MRLIGINAPDRQEEAYHEAIDYLRQFEAKTVVLEREGENHRFGRLLRHAFVDNENLAVSMIENGHAAVYRNYEGRHLGELLEASG